MTYNASDENLDLGSDYVKLEEGFFDCLPCVVKRSETTSCCRDGGGWGLSLWWWAKLVLVLLFVVALVAVFFQWVGPFVMDKEIIPLLIWERKTFSTTMLAIIVFSSLAIFPSILLPSTPSMWVAGMTFGYVYGFLLTVGGVAIGVSFPYFTGSIFYHKIHVWLERYPKKACLIKLAGEGDWFNQFRAVAFIRISPFPYIVYNYCAVATDVKYGPYLLGTIVGMLPEIFVALYTGIMIQTIADASNDRHTLTVPQVIFNVIGFCITMATTVMVTLYSKKRVKQLQLEEHLLLN